MIGARAERALVIHNSFNTAGGGERVCLGIIEALQECNYVVTILTPDKTDWAKLELLLSDIDISRIRSKLAEEINLTDSNSGTIGIHRKLLALHYINLKMKGGRNFDLVINTSGDVVPTFCDYTYVYLPLHLLSKKPTFVKNGNHAPRRQLEEMLYRRYLKIFFASHLKGTIPLFVSNFSRDLFGNVFSNSNGQVLYPPVSVFDRKNDSIKNSFSERKNVLTISRFVREKNLEKVVAIAELCKNVNFCIIGGTGSHSQDTISKLETSIKEKYLTNVLLYFDAPIKIVQEIMNSSLIYLHSMENEHFGISIIEAMSAGLIPLVHRSGGPYYDIIDKDKYGYSYDNEFEAAEIIKLLTDDSQFERLKARINDIQQRAEIFNKENFKKHFTEIIKSQTTRRQNTSQ